LIAPHPGSSLDAFGWEAEEPTRFLLDKVYWLVPNEGIAQQLDYLETRLEQACMDTRCAPEIHDLWLEIGIEEVLEYLDCALRDHRLDFTPGDKTRLVITSALEWFSVGQIFTFVWRAAKDAAAYYARGNVDKRRAANTVVGSIQRQAERAHAEGWPVRQAWRDRRCPQSELSRLFSTRLLSSEDATLKMRPQPLLKRSPETVNP
jgi:hypothetical protein